MFEKTLKIIHKPFQLHQSFLINFEVIDFGTVKRTFSCRFWKKWSNLRQKSNISFSSSKSMGSTGIILGISYIWRQHIPKYQLTFRCFFAKCNPPTISEKKLTQTANNPPPNRPITKQTSVNWRKNDHRMVKNAQKSANKNACKSANNYPAIGAQPIPIGKRAPTSRQK